MTRRDVAAASPSRTAEPTDPRLAAAREVLAILRGALPADGQLELVLAPGQAPTRTAAVRVVVNGPDAVARVNESGVEAAAACLRSGQSPGFEQGDTGPARREEPCGRAAGRPGSDDGDTRSAHHAARTARSTTKFQAIHPTAAATTP